MKFLDRIFNTQQKKIKKHFLEYKISYELEHYLKDIRKFLNVKLVEFKTVEENERGKKLQIIDKLLILTFLTFTRRNEVRGGILHPDASKHFIVLAGRIYVEYKRCVTCPPKAGISEKMLIPTEHLIIEKGTPYLWISMGEPSVVLEWIEGEQKEESFKEFWDQVNMPL